jgi:hypothetical protein
VHVVGVSHDAGEVHGYRAAFRFLNTLPATVVPSIGHPAVSTISRSTIYVPVPFPIPNRIPIAIPISVPNRIPISISISVPISKPFPNTV